MNKVIILFFIIGWIFLSSCDKKAEPETHLLPDGFVGRVIIFFDRSDGKAKEYDNDKRIYRIPKNGILKTNFSSNDGFLKYSERNFFYIDNAGKIKPISTSWTKNGEVIIHPSIVQVFGFKVGRSNDTLAFEEYIVDSYSRAGEYKDLYNLDQYLDSKVPLPKKNSP